MLVVPREGRQAPEDRSVDSLVAARRNEEGPARAGPLGFALRAVQREAAAGSGLAATAEAGVEAIVDAAEAASLASIGAGFACAGIAVDAAAASLAGAGAIWA